ncbi:SCP2 sterol-binding domain-containing protein [Haloarcula montana]|uniref:SCP2 sterol-binding domain-containing protein n=1 Tax=Haloarcula montana TaxID=3111776 RepID=UPI002D781AFD|nr:SCP2 sterol-binding domain-containing protein [Haloarcula sp. GH36]
MSVTLPGDADEWATQWRDRLNDRTEFRTAAEEFVATFEFEIQADDTYEGDSVTIVVDVDDGTCTGAAISADGDYDFALRGPYAAWKALLQGELDVSESVMSGTFDVEGNTMTLLRRQDAIAEMVAAAQGIDTGFEY